MMRGSQALRKGHRATGLFLLACLAIAAFMASACPAGAQVGGQAATVGLGARTEAGFGRLTFDFGAPVQYNAFVQGSQLIVVFDTPVAGDLAVLRRGLPGYVQSVSLSEDRRTVYVSLTGNYGLRSFSVGTAVVVDLLGQPAASPPVLESAPAPAPASADPAAAVPPPFVPIRTGRHDGFFRIVFDWPQAPGYRLFPESGQTLLRFDRPAQVDLEGLRSRLPEALRGLDAFNEAGQLHVIVPVPENGRLRDFRAGNRVVVDAVAADTPSVRSAASPTPARPESPATAESGVEGPPPPEAAPVTEVADAALPTPARPGDAETATAASAATASAAATATADDGAADSAPVRRVRQIPEDAAIASLSFSFNEPTAAAVFERAGYVWVVFDRYTEVDLRLLRRLGKDIVRDIRQIPHSKTVIRMILREGYHPAVRREQLLWIVDLIPLPMQPEVPIPVETEFASAVGPRFFLRVPEGGETSSVVDPEVGDQLLVVPVIPLSYGVDPARVTPDLELLKSVQGIAVAPRVDGISLRSTRDGVEISNPVNGGLSLSRDRARAGVMAESDRGTPSSIFDVGAWQRGGTETFIKDRQELLDAIVTAARDLRTGPRLDLARFYFANGRGHEALGVLRVALQQDPTLENEPAFRALRGAARFLAGRDEEAIADLSVPALEGVDEAQFWKAVALAASGDDPGAQALTLQATAGVMQNYPRRLRVQLAMIVAESAIAANDDLMARNFLELAEHEDNTPLENAGLQYWTGRLEELMGAFNDALQRWDEVGKGPSRKYRALARLARVKLLLNVNQIDAAEAIEELEKLRTAWRGDDVEFEVLTLLADQYVGDGNYPDALRTLKALASAFRQDPRIEAVTERMTGLFEELYLEGRADEMSPVEAIALYDEFRELTPAGCRGDDMIQKLADRLVGVDLLAEAGALLDRQIRLRAQCVDKPQVGSRLALLYLLNENPGAALQVLEDTAVGQMPDELAGQRRRLEARALADLDRVDEAIALLSRDRTREGQLLRAEINWDAQRWAAAAAAIEELIEMPPRGEPFPADQVQRVIDAAAALTLAGDDRGLARMRRSYMPHMEGTPLADAFDLITAGTPTAAVDMQAIGQEVAQAESFRAFMSEYRNRVREEGLSAIN